MSLTELFPRLIDIIKITRGGVKKNEVTDNKPEVTDNKPEVTDNNPEVTDNTEVTVEFTYGPPMDVSDDRDVRVDVLESVPHQP